MDKIRFWIKRIQIPKRRTCSQQVISFWWYANKLKKKQTHFRFFTRGRHKRIGIIQWEQFTQDAAYLEKVNIDYVVLVPPFTEYAAQYYHEKFMSLLPARKIVKLGVDLQQELVKKIIWSLAI